jgi:CHAD domain-containing protein
MADGKWVPDLRSDMPVEEAARLVLKSRLGVVAKYLPLSVERADEDPEHVHQLRVGTRRAGAALDIFQQCLPPKQHRTAARVLRKLRRAAGEARDWDVFQDMLAVWKPRATDARSGLDFLAGFAAGKREAAQARLVDVGERKRVGLHRVESDLPDAARAPDLAHEPPLFGALAHTRIGNLFRDLERTATPIPTDYDHLHQIRIAGKRLRYAMEVFADCFPPEFRERLYPAVEEMQEILGAANDSHVAAGRLGALTDALRRNKPAGYERLLPGIAGLAKFHQRRLPRQRRLFEAWWRDWEYLRKVHPIIVHAVG